MLVPSARGRSNLCVAVQAPMVRLSIDKALQLLPPLQSAALALSKIEAGAVTSDEPGDEPSARRRS